MKRVSSVIFASLCLSACDAGNYITAKSDADAAPLAASENTHEAAKETLAPLGYLLDVNDATHGQLKRVPGMTTKIDELIKKTRPFISMVEFDDELDLIGVSDKNRAVLYEHLFMMVDVNNAAFKEYSFVPGLSSSLAQAIQAGRPYEDRRALVETMEANRKNEDVERLASYFKVLRP